MTYHLTSPLRLSLIYEIRKRPSLVPIRYYGKMSPLALLMQIISLFRIRVTRYPSALSAFVAWARNVKKSPPHSGFHIFLSPLFLSYYEIVLLFFCFTNFTFSWNKLPFPSCEFRNFPSDSLISCPHVICKANLLPGVRTCRSSLAPRAILWFCLTRSFPYLFPYKTV